MDFVAICWALILMLGCAARVGLGRSGTPNSALPDPPGTAWASTIDGQKELTKPESRSMWDLRISEDLVAVKDIKCNLNFC